MLSKCVLFNGFSEEKEMLTLVRVAYLMGYVCLETFVGQQQMNKSEPLCLHVTVAFVLCVHSCSCLSTHPLSASLSFTLSDRYRQPVEVLLSVPFHLAWLLLFWCCCMFTDLVLLYRPSRCGQGSAVWARNQMVS